MLKSPKSSVKPAPPMDAAETAGGKISTSLLAPVSRSDMQRMRDNAQNEDRDAVSKLVKRVEHRVVILSRVMEIRRRDGLEAAIAEVQGGRGPSAMAAVESAADVLMRRHTTRLEHSPR